MLVVLFCLHGNNLKIVVHLGVRMVRRQLRMAWVSSKTIIFIIFQEMVTKPNKYKLKS